MGEKLRALLVKRFGMSETSTDAQASAYLAGVAQGRGLTVDLSGNEEAIILALDASVASEGNRRLLAAQREVEEAVNDTVPAASGNDTVQAGSAPDITTSIQEAVRQQRAAERQLARDISAECARFGMADYAGELIAQCDDIGTARNLILDRIAESQQEAQLSGISIQPGAARNEKLDNQLKTAFLLGALESNGFQQETIEDLVPVAERQQGWQDFRYASMLDIAARCLQMNGVRTDNLPRESIAMAALGFPQQAGIRMDAGYAYHTTGNFSNLTLDAINKTLLAAYMEAPSTWQVCFRQGRSVPDFKNIHRVKLGESPNLDVWPDNTSPNTVSFADEKETYAVQPHSAKTGFSYQLLVNDDMDALTRMPVMLGAASRRTVNAHAWSIITANAKLSDGVALFSAATGNRKKSNFTASGAAPSVAQVGVGKNLMRQQVGLNTPEAGASQAILNLTPAYIAVPSALETTTEQLLNSLVDPDASVTGVVNPTRSLTQITEPLLDANSTTAWYLFAQPTMIDTVEVTFLQGQETPRVRNWQDPETLSLMYAVLQTFAAKAIDFRGMYKDNGA